MSTDAGDSVSRRGFLRAATGAAVATGAAGTAAAQEGGGNESGGNNSTSGGNQTTGGNQSSGGGGGGGGTKEVVVGPGGNLTFEPAELQVLPGTTVKWVWESDNHNVVPETVPEGATWEGSEGAPSKLFNTGHTYEHTFETKGDYPYFCQPHKSSGMVGTIKVVESISTPQPAAGPPEIPDSAKSLGIATTLGMLSTLGLAYFFMKYGGDYGVDEE